MKSKLLSFLLILAVLTLTACGGAGGVSDNSQSVSSISQNSVIDSSSNGENQNSSSTVNSTQSSTQNSNNSSVNPSSNSSSNLSSSSSSGTDDGRELKTDITDPKKPNQYEYTLNNTDPQTGAAVVSSVSAFNAEGYGSNVTGGGDQQPGASDYIQVTTPEEFVRAISRSNTINKDDTGFATRPMVVEVMNDLDFGWNLISSTVQGISDIAASGDQPSVHPVLKNTGISVIYLTGRQNLTIFSSNASVIKHVCFQIRGNNGQPSKNIIIRNLKFYGAWEWDDGGGYDDNDWDIFTIRADKGPVSDIWIDHCTFTKPYDGTIDVKYHATDITISWCSFIPYDNEDTDFMAMMNYLEQNRSSFNNYNAARNAGATFDEMIMFASINKKVHLIGHTDNFSGDDVFRITYANNYYYNCTERLPRLRMGKAHVYNCIFDAAEVNEFQNSIVARGIAWPGALSIAANGSLGTNYGQLLLENCNINGIMTPLRNNNNKEGIQFVGAADALYTYYTIQNINRSASYGTTKSVIFNGRYTFLGHSTKPDGNLMTPFPSTPLDFDTDKFKSDLNYEYTLYNPLNLYLAQNGNVGAGKMEFSISQWLRSSYSTAEAVSNPLPANGIKGSSTNKNASRI